jgi:protein arginine kinase activator
MLCEDCQQRVATVVYTEVSEGAKNVLHLCQQCVEERGIHAPGLKNPLEMDSLFEDMLENAQSEGLDESALADDVTCPSCDWTLERFRHTGRLGCPTCYDAFAESLRGLLRRIHGSNENLGKSYRRNDEPGLAERDPDSLRRALEAAVGDEDFEKAAELRDRINRLNTRSG